MSNSQIATTSAPGSRVAQAVADLRRTSGRFTTAGERGEAVIAMLTAADLLKSMETELRRIHQIAGETINA